MSLQEYDSAARPPRAIEELLDLTANGSILAAFISRNLKVRYKRSVLGMAWTLAQPAAMLIVLTAIFSHAFAPHAPFYPAYLGPGLLLWYFFAQSTAVVIAEVAGGVDLWRRVRVPKTAPAVATTCTALFNLALATIPLLLVLALVGRPLGLALLSLPVVALLTAMFALGLALTISAIALYFPDVADLYSVVLSAWMFITPVIYPPEILPESIRRFVALNPMTLFVEAFRRPMYDDTVASGGDFAILFAIAAGTLMMGWYVFARSADEIPYRG